MSAATLMNFGPHRDLTFEQARTQQPGFLSWGRRQEKPSRRLKMWLDYCNRAEAQAPSTQAGSKRRFSGTFDCPDHGPMAGPFTCRNGMPHNIGRQFYTCRQCENLTGFRWADGTAPFSAESCRRVETYHGATAGSIGVGPILGMVADHLDDDGKPVGPWHGMKRQKVGQHAVSEDGEDNSDAEDDSDAEAERAEKLEQAEQCECIYCGEAHPDPEQLVEDDPAGCADLPTKRDSNGWSVINDDWTQGICPDCRSEHGLEEESSSEIEKSEEDSEEESEEESGDEQE